MMYIEQLNNKHAIANQLYFFEGSGGLPMMRINNAKANALISIYAGQVLSYQPKNEPEDMLFLSEKAYYQDGKAIKGGVPICWPWFGPDPNGQGASHGFMRNRMWRLQETGINSEGDIVILLDQEASEKTKTIWPYSFELTQQIIIGDSINLALITKNTGDQSFPVTQAFHTYFKIGDINQTKVSGLENCSYIDKTENGIQKQQSGAVIVNSEVDRIYLQVKNTQIIEDAALSRRIHISSSGNNTMVVWNPWQKIAADMADLMDSDYKKFICVETTNAANDVIDVAPGGDCQLTANYYIER